VKGEAVASSGPGAVATVPEVAGCATPGLVELGVYCVRPLKWPQDGSRPQENTPNATRTEGTGGTSRIPKKQRRELPHGSRERGGWTTVFASVGAGGRGGPAVLCAKWARPSLA